ncbi:MAG: T9SS type A sorting domain-containing protein [Bacteroidales bacterium]|nr:T9SS type A sorting domain-containing protein [Bacteroidales bacterium]
MKHFALSFITVVLLHVSLHAQQWEFDYGDAQSWTWYINGIVDSEGNTVMVGGYASEFPNYHPIVMRVGPDGTHNRHEYEGLEGLLLKDVVQLPNGNYFAVGDFSGEAFGVMILDANLEMVAAKRYEREGASLYYYFGVRLLLDDDGTVVMSGTASTPRPIGGYESRPCLYRFDENADTLRSRYVVAELPDPEYFFSQYRCHQILRNPQNDGLILVGVGKHGRPALILYDYDFNYISDIWIEHIATGSFIYPFGAFSSSCWMSDEDLLVFATLKPSSEQERTVALLDMSLSEGCVTRLDTIRCDSLPYHIAYPDAHNTAFANDTTIYGSYYSTDDMYSRSHHPSVCLFNKDMEVLGNYVFYDENYIGWPGFILPQNDGGCILAIENMFGSLSNRTAYGKLVKLSREDFNPIPCGVEEAPQEEAKALAYPNPAKDELNIDITGLSENGRLRVQITDALGHVCMERVIRGDGNVMKLDIKPLKPGLYFYTIQDTQKGSLKGKFVKE